MGGTYFRVSVCKALITLSECRDTDVCGSQANPIREALILPYDRKQSGDKVWHEKTSEEAEVRVIEPYARKHFPTMRARKYFAGIPLYRAKTCSVEYFAAAWSSSSFSII